MKRYDVIGKYVNSTKKEELLADFFIRPILYIDNYVGSTPPKNAIELIKNRTVRIFIIAACSKQDIIEKGMVNETMTRSNTEFLP